MNKRYRGHTILTLKEISRLKNIYISKGWGAAQWMIFSERMIKEGFKVKRIAAYTTESNYLEVTKNGITKKVRFSTHRNSSRCDADYYVGGFNGCDTGESIINKILEDYRVTQESK